MPTNKFSQTKSLLLRADWSDTAAPWKEEHLQQAIVDWLDARGVLFSVGMEGMRISSHGIRNKLKAQGALRAGRCDIVLYADDGACIHIELKTGKGRLSAAQEKWHSRLRARGHDVHVIKTATPTAAVSAIETICFDHGVVLRPVEPIFNDSVDDL